MTIFLRRLAVLGDAVMLAALAVGCVSKAPPAPTAPAAGQPGSPPSAQPTVSATPIRRVDAPPLTPTPTPAPVPNSNPQTAVFPATLPANYARSCAAPRPWGQRVTAPFICIDGQPEIGTGRDGRSVTIRGYAGGGGEDELVMEWQIRGADGTLTPVPPGRTGWPLNTPGPGQPGLWLFTVDRPQSVPGATVLITAVLELDGEGRSVLTAKAEVPVR